MEKKTCFIDCLFLGIQKSSVNDEHENSCGIQNIVRIPYGALYRLGIQITSSHEALTIYLMGTLRVL